MFPFCSGNPEAHGAVASKTAAFPFEARHVTPDGKPIMIESLSHLRQVERAYGVAFTAFNNNPSNWTDNLRDLPKYRGEELNRRA